MSECVIAINNLTKQFDNATPLKGLSTKIYAGDVISIIGPSGTGKSTLLRCINRLETPTSGEIIVLGTDVTKEDTQLDIVRQKMGMVFQSFNLFNHLTVLENIISAPISLKKMPKDQAINKAMELLSIVGLTDKVNNFPMELSGGQKQRVAIARALAMEPEILLFDEPTSALDPTMVKEVENVIENLSRENLTMLIVTHEMNLAKNISTRVFYLDEGVIYEEGTPEDIFEHPKLKKTKKFINSIKNLEISSLAEDCDIEEAFIKIDRFAKDNSIDRRLKYKIKQVYDEMIMAGIINYVEKGIKIVFKASCEDKNLEIEILYNGPSVNPFEKMDQISKTIMDNLGHSEYSYAEDINNIKIILN